MVFTVACTKTHIVLPLTYCKGAVASMACRESSRKAITHKETSCKSWHSGPAPAQGHPPGGGVGGRGDHGAAEGGDQETQDLHTRPDEGRRCRQG